MSSEIIATLHPFDGYQGNYEYVRNFTVTVKERQEGQPCLLVLEEEHDIGLDKYSVAFDMPPGSDFRDAKNVARELNNLNIAVRLY